MITAYFDGGARGNPGPAGFGVYIVDHDGTVLAEIAEGIGVATNNVAEYRGLLAALQWAVDHGVKALAVKGDSQLLIQQMLGNYRVKNEGLLPLYRRARHLVVQIGDVSFAHVRREQNRDADRLSNIGMDQGVPGGAVI
jgi:ribonuclease HI